MEEADKLAEDPYALVGPGPQAYFPSCCPDAAQVLLRRGGGRDDRL